MANTKVTGPTAEEIAAADAAALRTAQAGIDKIRPVSEPVAVEAPDPKKSKKR